jgi:predicted HD phosphohydrolase
MKGLPHFEGAAEATNWHGVPFFSPDSSFASTSGERHDHRHRRNRSRKERLCRSWRGQGRQNFGGFPVDRRTHSLQTATLAYRDGRDEEYVVCALLHDLGDLLGSFNHPDFAAVVLQPFVSEANHWMVKHHGIFQGYYFFHHLGLDKNMRDEHRDSPYFKQTAEFCALYDGAAFNPDLECMPLEAFEPMLRRVFAKPKNSGVYARMQPGGQ